MAVGPPSLSSNELCGCKAQLFSSLFSKVIIISCPQLMCRLTSLMWLGRRPMDLATWDFPFPYLALALLPLNLHRNPLAPIARLYLNKGKHALKRTPLYAPRALLKLGFENPKLVRDDWQIVQTKRLKTDTTLSSARASRIRVCKP